MNEQFKTEQERFWAGEFGNAYVERNRGAKLLASNMHLFSNALRTTRALTSCIEFGANIGLNLQAIQALHPEIDCHGIEINQQAVEKLDKIIPENQIYKGSILEFTPQRTWDIALIKGVLIHINPDALKTVYQKLYQASSRYILIAEYYNPTPVTIPYRGHQDRLYKRDFAGELMELYPDLHLLDYGFVYHKDPNFPQDDTTWFLMQKS